MRGYRTEPAQVNFSERHRAVTSGAAYVVEHGLVLTKTEQSDTCPSAWNALERHATEATRRGIFAEERREAA